MHTIPTDTTQPTTQIPTESPLPDRLVSFGGDGEPKSARSMLQTLIEFEEEVGLDSDSYSLGWQYSTGRGKIGGDVGKGSSSLYADRHPC